jgi:hypothetical protein
MTASLMTFSQMTVGQMTIISPPRYNIQNATVSKIGQSYETCKRTLRFVLEVLPCTLRNTFLNCQQNLKKI